MKSAWKQNSKPGVYKWRRVDKERQKEALEKLGLELLLPVSPSVEPLKKRGNNQEEES